MTNKYIVLILISFVLGACRKDKDIINVVDNEYPIEKYINTSLKGLVVGDRDIPVEDATIIVGNYSVKTDFNGYFYFQDIKVNKEGATVEVSKEGYRTVTKTFYPQLNSTTYIQIRIQPTQGATIINSDDKDKNFGSSVSFVSISGNSFTKNSEKYSGELMIIPYWNIFYNNDFNSKYIAHPVGYDKFYRLKGLNSFGIVGLDIKDRYGNKIDLGDGNDMELRLIFDKNDQLPDEMPEKIPVWYFDYSKDKWLEKAEAVYNNSNRYYSVFVKDAGYWNFAKPIDIEYSQFAVKSKNNKKLPNIKTLIKSNASNYILDLRSNDDGDVVCFLPKNESSEIEFYIGDIVVNKTIEPGEKEIKISSDFKVVKVIGDFYNCDDSELKNGYITLFTSVDTTFYKIIDGKLDRNIIVNKEINEIKWYATDVDNRINTGIHNSLISDSEMNVQEVFLCQESFALLRYGDVRQLLFLKGVDYNDPPVLAVVFENDEYYIDLGFFDFKGVSENYNLNIFNYTIIIDRNDNNRIFPLIGTAQMIKVSEFDDPGMMRGHIEGMAIHKDSGEVIDTALLKIDYSIVIE